VSNVAATEPGQRVATTTAVDAASGRELGSRSNSATVAPASPRPAGNAQPRDAVGHRSGARWGCRADPGAALAGSSPDTTGQDYGQHVVSCAHEMGGFDGTHNPGMHHGFAGWVEHSC
jgi:hypothetical protein